MLQVQSLPASHDAGRPGRPTRPDDSGTRSATAPKQQAYHSRLCNSRSLGCARQVGLASSSQAAAAAVRTGRRVRQRRSDGAAAASAAAGRLLEQPQEGGATRRFCNDALSIVRSMAADWSGGAACLVLERPWQRLLGSGTLISIRLDAVDRRSLHQMAQKGRAEPMQACCAAASGAPGGPRYLSALVDADREYTSTPSTDCEVCRL